MIEEDYVSFETAKLLKEKGFDAECHSHYYPCHYPDGSIQYHKYESSAKRDRYWSDIYSLKTLPVDHYLAPTLQMAQKWFREEKHLAINPSTFYNTLEGHEFHNWGCNIVNLDTWELYCSNPLETFPADTYEEALEKAMKYALENFV